MLELHYLQMDRQARAKGTVRQMIVRAEGVIPRVRYREIESRRPVVDDLKIDLSSLSSLAADLNSCSGVVHDL